MYTHPLPLVLDDHATPALSSPAPLACQSNARRLGLVGYYSKCLHIARQRKDLLALDDTALKDIGISRVAARREAERSFWDIPEAMKRYHR